MAIVNKKGSINLEGLDSKPVIMPESRTQKGILLSNKEIVEVDATDDNGSTYRMARIPTNAILNELTIKHDAITGGTDFVVGFYEINDGAAINANVLLASTSFASAGTVDGLSNIDIADSAKQVWELIGLAKDSNSLVDVVITGNVVGTASGTIATNLIYSV